MNIEDIKVGQKYRIVGGTDIHNYAMGSFVTVANIEGPDSITPDAPIETHGLIGCYKAVQWVSPDHLVPA